MYKVFLGEKLNNWVGLLLVTSIAAFFAFLLSNNLLLGLEVFAAIIGLCILCVCVFSTTAGLYIIMLYTFSASGLSRFLLNDQLPVGVVIDILVFATFLGLFFSNDSLKGNASRFFRARPVIWYSLIVVYLTLELFNPIGHSVGGWLQVMRKVFESFLIVFIAYNVFDSVAKIKMFIKALFFFTLLLGAYGCFQQWHGLLPTEINWVNADELRYGLIAIWGEYRKFSFLGGPTEFGMVMASCSVFFILVGLNERKLRDKIIYLVGSVFMILGMSYSGTRTANAMFAGGLVLFLLLTIDKKASRFLAIAAVLAFLFVMYVPIYSSATLLRFRSTFSATQDASYNVRETNRKSVQPFIWTHPAGSGLSTTGAMGQRYNPANPNAGFPTDSSYLNKALESGWIGMLLTCILYFFMLQYTFRGYFLARNRQFKTWFAAAAAFFFSFFLGEMTQEAVGVISNMAVYFPIFALVLRLREFSEGIEKPVSNV
ncbi:MAG: O-antigen ligase family protein [Flavisolibacter sp.]